MTNKLSPTEIFNGRKIFLIGGTGFLGKVTLSMLLHRFPNIGRVYVTVRARSKEESETRFWNNVISAPPFDPVRERYGAAFEDFVRDKVAIVGGDISRTPARVVVDSVVLGEVRRGRAVLRSGALVGDQIFVTGSLGGAAAGLKILESRAVSQSEAKLTRAQRQLVLRQTRPVPRVEWGALVGERRLATAMIDLSDGLSSDLAHLCRESGVGARVEAALLPVEPLLKFTSANVDEALSLALDGGEDFELLFTVRARDASKLPEELGGVSVTRVGEITGARGKIKIVRGGREHVLKPGGFEHFRRDKN